MQPVHKRPAFSLVDLLAALAASTTLLALAAAAIGRVQPAAAPPDPAAAPDPAVRAAAMRAKDVTQLRGVLHSHIVWATSNADKYPLPSLIDTNDHTVRDIGPEKDTTSNINSLLLYNGFLPPGMLVSPLETSTAIVADLDYVYDRPPTAADPEQALWDPAFTADFSVGEANVSYANLQPSGGRADRWGRTLQAAEPVVGDRAPEIEAAAQQPDGTVVVTLANPQSKTLSMFGDGTSWSGNLGYNDASVRPRENALKSGAAYALADRLYAGAQARIWPDIWCYDEPDDGESTNDYLGIFVRAGRRPEMFKAIWD